MTLPDRGQPPSPELSSAADDTSGIAVVGMAGRFPGAPDLTAFWHNLTAGVESLTRFSAGELAASGVSREVREHPDYVPVRGILAEVDRFDAEFFGLNAREAELMDPQQRLFLEVAWEALEDAGHDPEREPGVVGVCAGSGTSTYLLRNLSGFLSEVGPLGDLDVGVGNERDALSTLTAYKLNLKGPCCTVQTFCSTSLVAVHLASQALLDYECDMALAGGVFIEVPQRTGYRHRPGSFASRDGHCRAFDAQASGTPFGNGVGVVVLKRWEDARDDGDRVRALIRGSAVNNDGALKVSYAAPSVRGQARVITEALANARVEPGSVSYVEAHGTGTELGDGVEITALNQAFLAAGGGGEVCALGSVKTNLGHLDRASGIAGLIKTVLCLEHRTLVPSLHFQCPNPKIDFAGGPFRVQTELAPWIPPAGCPRRAGVSSFGLGGTNAHVVLEEAPEVPASGPSRHGQLLALSARSPEALAELSSRLSTYLGEHPEVALADVSYTLLCGRRAFEHRRAVVCAEVGEAAVVLGGGEPARLLEGSPRQRQRPVVFLFPGLGEDLRGVGAELYREEPVFRRVMEDCCGHLGGERGEAVRVLLCGPSGASESGGVGSEASGPGPVSLREVVRGGSRGLPTELSQPALFVYEYALARLWESWGIEPEALLGYSVGEYVAACLSGVLEEADAVRLVADRGSWIGRQPRGGMVAVGLGAREVEEFLPAGTWIGAWSGPSSSVVSGREDALSALGERLERAGVAWRSLAVEHAFHSPLLAPVGEALRERISALRLGAPRIPYLSNLTGDWVVADQVASPEYWVEQMCGPVRLSRSLERVWEEGERILLEVGPGQALSSLALQHPGAAGAGEAVVAASHGGSWREAGVGAPSVRRRLLEALGRLWVAGCELPGEALFRGETRRRVALPTYPFQRCRYWIENGRNDGRPGPASAEGGSGPAVEEAGQVARLYAATWRRSWRRLEEESAAGTRWLVLGDPHGPGRDLGAALAARGARVWTAVPAGDRQDGIGEAWSLELGDPVAWDRLLDVIGQEGGAPSHVLHTWTWTGPPPRREDGEPAPARRERCQERGYFALLDLARSLARRWPQAAVRLQVVADGLSDVTGEAPLDPAKATLLGPLRVIPLEYPNLRCRLLDVARPAASETGGDTELAALLRELLADDGEEWVAHRGGRRWVRTLVPVTLAREASRLRRQGAYLITGGTGGLGRLLAVHLARTRQARLALVARKVDDDLSREIAAEIERLGGNALLLAADVSERSQVAAALARARRHFGRLDGVFHLAGVLADGPIELKSRQEALRVFAPKVHGALHLLAEAGEDLDFLLLFSSLAAEVGNFGQVDYAAANACLDLLATGRARDGRSPIVAVGWDAWRGVGRAAQAVEHAAADRPGTLAASVLAGGLTPEAGLAALEQILAAERVPNLVIAAREPQQLRESLEELSRSLKTPDEGNLALRPRHLATPYAAPADVTQERIAEIWRHALRLESVGIHDDFFALGGHSLIAIQILGRLRDAFGVEVTLEGFLKSSTVARLADRIEASIVRELEALDEEQAQRLAAELDEPPAPESGAPLAPPRLCTLPNGLAVWHLNQAETEQFYRDIFEHRCYLRHLHLEDGAVVFDVGANLGLFCLFVHGAFPRARLYAFEPAPAVFELLRRNTEPLGDRVHLFPCGLSDRKATAALTYYPHSTGLSSFYGDPEEERRLLAAVFANQRLLGLEGVEPSSAQGEALLERRLRAQTVPCPLTTLSEVLRSEGVPRIDLLKIDVQKSELDVLTGLEDGDWERVRQIAMEIHDLDGRLERARSLLAERGFQLAIEQDELYAGSDVFNLYAWRAAPGSSGR